MTALSVIAELLKANESYVEKSAIVGGNTFIILAQKAIIALSGRMNFKAFKTEAEAIEWLKG